jgi:chemotaxis protein histidine kinase CheA
MKLLRSFGAILAFIPCLAYAWSQDQVIVQGEPPLTRAMVDRARDFIEWVFEVPLTADQRKTIDEMIVEYWTEKREEDIQGTLQILEAANEIAALPADARASVRAQLQPLLVAELRKDDSAQSKWLMEIYDSAHKPLLPGNPPLTRQMSDAQAEMFAFMISEVTGEEFVPDKAYLDAWAQTLVKNYAKMNEAQRKEVAQAPIDWANLRYTWARVPEDQKAEARKLWAKQLESVIPASASQQALDKAVKRAEKALGGKSLEQVTQQDLNEAAQALEEAATVLAKEQGEESKKMSAQLKQTAAELRKAGAEKAAAASSGRGPGGATKGLQEAFARVQAEQASFSSMMNASMQMHYTRSNSINILGGNPMRYVNQFGTPY